MPPSIDDYVARLTRAARHAGKHSPARPRPLGRSGVVTVVTAALNSVRTINRTIDSVASQTYPLVEYIVIDGGSTDGTVDTLESRGNVIDLWLSEPDNGISDAFNKGIALATGEYVALVNADDWLEPTHLALAVNSLAETGADFVYGDLIFHPIDEQPPFMFVGEVDYYRRLEHAMPCINHPTVVCRRSVYETHGLFDTGLRAAMDYEWLLRGYRAGVRGAYVPGMASHMSMEGVSHRNYARGLKEVYATSIRYGYPASAARLRYVVRLLKVRTRLMLLVLVPKTLYEWLRCKVNPQYRRGNA